MQSCVNWFHGLGCVSLLQWQKAKADERRLWERRKSSHQALLLLNTQSLAVVSYHFGGLLLHWRQQSLGLQSCTLEFMHAKCTWAVLLALWELHFMWKDKIVGVSLQDQWLNNDAQLANNRGPFRLEETSGGHLDQSSSWSRFSCFSSRSVTQWRPVKDDNRNEPLALESTGRLCMRAAIQFLSLNLEQHSSLNRLQSVPRRDICFRTSWDTSVQGN